MVKCFCEGRFRGVVLGKEQKIPIGQFKNNGKSPQRYQEKHVCVCRTHMCVYVITASYGQEICGRFLQHVVPYV